MKSGVLSSPMILMYIFAGLIAIGTFFLILPFAHHGNGFTPFIDAFFTATSAVTVTGLTTLETSTYWTRTGQIFILALVFTGGLSFMTIATFLLILIGQRLTLSQRVLLKDSLQIDQLGGLARLTIRIVLVATGIQLLGFIALLFRFSALPEYSTAEAIWHAAFHSISSFNSAGFTIIEGSESLSAFKIDKIFLLITGTLIFLGSIGYWVIIDVLNFRKYSLLTLNSKLVIIVTFALTFAGSVAFLLSEYNNPETLGLIPFADKISVSIFESISGRTAGFSTVDHGKTLQHTNFFFISLMCIGGASASVAGGIKVNTIAVILVAVISVVSNRQQTSIFGREIPQEQVRRAMSIGVIAIIFVFLVGFTLTLSENISGGHFPFLNLLFESVSAAGTVGLSTGLTPDLSRSGHLILITTMFIGRVGLPTLILYISQGNQHDLYRYAQERVTIA